jgi:hypothetical protein
MANRQKPDPDQPPRRATFADVTREIANRNDAAQKVARARRTAREKEENAVRRQWRNL